MEKAYTPEQTLELVANYQAGQSVDELALKLGKSVRSVVAKLAREGVYQKQAQVAKQAGTKKADLVKQLEVAAGCELSSLLKATKEDLQQLIKLL